MLVENSFELERSKEVGYEHHGSQYASVESLDEAARIVQLLKSVALEQLLILVLEVVEQVVHVILYDL